jgi:hypothetical protein
LNLALEESSPKDLKFWFLPEKNSMNEKSRSQGMFKNTF